MTRITKDDRRLHVWLDGPGGNAPWLVFGNSLLTDLSVWDAQVKALSGAWNILRYDQRGHGGSEIWAGEATFQRLGDDLLDLLDQVGVGACVYVGLSMGVPTGLAAYDRAPERFRALVFLDGQAKSAPGAADTWSARIETARANGMQAFAAETAGRWLVGPDSAGLRPALEAMIAATPFAGFEYCATALKSYDFAAVLPRITCPVLLMAGLDDGAMPATMQGMAGAIPAAVFEGIPEAGHIPCFEQPARVNHALLRFLDGLEGAR